MRIEDIYAAQERIKPYLSPTPLIFSSLIKQKLGQTSIQTIGLKLETQLPTGSFKPRPAFNSILAQLEKAKKYGVIASSSGNFAQAVAYAASVLGVSAWIVMPSNTSPYKIQRTKEWGAEVIICPEGHQNRIETTTRLQKETGRFLLQPYNSEDTIAGDGTIGLELAAQMTSTNFTVLVPVSGGGLLAGIAFTLKTKHPNCKVIGVQPTVNGSLASSLQAGKCVQVARFQTIADALVAETPGDVPFEIIKHYVDDVVLVEEEEIKAATRYLIEQHKLVVEPAGAVPLAALFAKKVTANEVICIVSGGNIPLSIPC